MVGNVLEGGDRLFDDLFVFEYFALQMPAEVVRNGSALLRVSPACIAQRSRGLARPFTGRRLKPRFSANVLSVSNSDDQHSEVASEERKCRRSILLATAGLLCSYAGVHACLYGPFRHVICDDLLTLKSFLAAIFIHQYLDVLQSK